MSDSTPITLNVPPEQAERLVRAMERASCIDLAACIADDYRTRVQAAFARHCPDRPYTGSPLDVDTLLAYLEHRIVQPRDRRAEDKKD